MASPTPRILIADDDRAIRESLARALSLEGYDVVQASDGAAALAQIEAVSPDAVVLDLRDPWALDGWHTYRHHFAWRRAMQAMRSALEAADGVIMNVPGARTAAEALAPRRGKTGYGDRKSVV